MLQKVLGKVFSPEYCLKTNFFFGCIHILLQAIFISKGKSVIRLPVWGEEEKLMEEAAASQAPPRGCRTIIFQSKFHCFQTRGQS